MCLSSNRSRVHIYLLGDHAFRWLRLDGFGTNLTPVSGEARTIALDIALHHGTFRVLICIRVDLLKQVVQGLIATLLLRILVNIRYDLVPVFGFACARDTGGCHCLQP